MGSPGGQSTAHYEIKNIEEAAHTDGKPVQTVYKIDVSTGRVWRLESSPLFDANNNKVLAWAEGWEPIADSVEEALKRAKAKWEEAAKSQASRPDSQR